MSCREENGGLEGEMRIDHDTQELLCDVRGALEPVIRIGYGRHM